MGHRLVSTASVALALTGLLLLAVEGPSAAAATASTLIVPGEAIGPARLGMSATNIAAVLGPSVPAGGGQLRFPRWGVTAAFQRGVAVRLSTANPELRTRQGAGVGTSLDEASHLVGDLNPVLTVTGSDTTVAYPFQGIGFAFRAGRAAEVFVVQPIPIGSQPVPARAAPAASLAARIPGSGAVRAGAAVAIEGLAETVDAATGLFRVTGRVINIGARPADSVTVTATFERITGDDSRKQQVLQQPIAPGAGVPFSFGTFAGTAPVGRYTVAVAAKSSEDASTAQETRTVALSEYAGVARQNIQVKVELGAPTASVRGMVQVFVSIADTGSIPQAWVTDVTVAIPFAGGSREVHLAPGQTVTVLVPPLPIVLGLGGEQPLVRTGSVVGPPQVTGVTLQAP